MIATASQEVAASAGWGKNGQVEISAKTEYAVRAMLQLADAAEAAIAVGAAGTGEVGPTSVDALAEAQGLPRRFLEAILADLRRAGLVVSTKGARGGYHLGRPATDIPIGAIFRAVDGPLAEVRGRRPQDVTYDGVARHLPVLWVAVRSSLRQVLDGTSLEQLRTGEIPDAVRALADVPDAWQNR
ncbi:MAG: Rrf2 family transcriptional regulator [Propioniciclava sp.]|uniref:RrF2 family transcriptional regulator n=1 Tax=Propioniciclava sp. TaxID=2038686 RepID=UPI0039E64B6A